jgi:hypothetical protein
MTDLYRALRRIILRMQLRSLAKQEEHIIHARAQAYTRLLEIERQCLRLENELQCCAFSGLRIERASKPGHASR